MIEHEVFISYSSKDKVISNALCSRLERNDIRCWIAPRDVQPGFEYSQEIVDAVSNSQIVVLVFSSDSNSSSQVKREIERAVSKEKIIIPFRVDETTPTGSMEHLLAGIHWLDAITPPIERHITSLVDTIKRILSSGNRLHQIDEAKAFEISWLLMNIVMGSRHDIAINQQILKYLEDFDISLKKPLNQIIAETKEDGGSSLMTLIEYIGGRMVANKPTLALYFQSAFNLLLDAARNEGQGISDIIEPLHLPQELMSRRSSASKWVNEIHEYFAKILHGI